jgi:hypothetical protein
VEGESPFARRNSKVLRNRKRDEQESGRIWVDPGEESTSPQQWKRISLGRFTILEEASVNPTVKFKDLSGEMKEAEPREKP